MQSPEILRSKLDRIDGKGYGACQSLKGQYAWPDFDLLITRIPKDPYAPPHTGIYRIRVDHAYLGIPPNLFDSPTAGIAYRDLLARRFSEHAGSISGQRRGTGYSGVITLDTPAQAILDRSAVVFTPGGVEVRFFIGLPAKGRRINGSLARTMLFQELPAIVEGALHALDPAAV